MREATINGFADLVWVYEEDWNAVFPAIIDTNSKGKLVAVWRSINKRNLHKRDYGKTWLAYVHRGVEG